MPEALIDLLPVALPLLMLWRIQPARPPRAAFHEDSLSLAAALPLRAIMALMVILHHLAQRTSAGWLMRPYADIGYWPVAMFFFLSGYGTMKKRMASPDYRRRFLRRRLGAVLIPFLPVMAVYAGIHSVIQPPAPAWDWINGVIGEANAWFIVNLLLFYAAFAAIMRLKPRPAAMVAFMAAFCAGYTALCVSFGYGDWWYKSSPAFILGMAWAVWGGSWLPFVRRRYWLLLLLSMTLCLVIHRNIWPLAWRLPLQAFIPSALSASLFVFSVLLLSMKLRVGNPALDYLGMISYDVYILHGLLLIVLRHECFLYVQDDCLYALLTLTGAVGLGGAYHWLRTRLTGSRRR